MTNKIIVTGGCGFIGSHTVVELLKSKYDVVIIDDLSNSSIEILDKIKEITSIKPQFVQLDLKDKEETASVIKENKDAVGVIHFAAYKAVGESIDKPLEYYNNNLGSLLNVLDSMQKHDVNNIIFSSSATVYGNPNTLPILESHQSKVAFSPYGNTKKIGEEIIEDVSKYTKLKAISLRYFNPIGAHESGLIGELPQGTPNNLMPYVTQTAIGKLKKLTVFGDDYDTADGTCIRDYIHVVDLAKAHLKAMNFILKNKNKKSYHIFNVGTGIGYSVLDIINTFEKVTNQKINYTIGKRRSGDVPVTYSDVEKASKELNWKAEKNLNDMIKSSWLWEQNYRNSKN